MRRRAAATSPKLRWFTVWLTSMRPFSRRGGGLLNQEREQNNIRLRAKKEKKERERERQLKKKKKKKGKKKKKKLFC